jgi:hypothetical protein
MSPVLARLMVKLHARAWRQRYGEEFEELLVDTPLTLGNFLNTAESAVESRKLTSIIPLVALASLVVTAFVLVLAHHSASSNPIQLSAAKDDAPGLHLGQSITFRVYEPALSPGRDLSKGC